ncbi:MAG: 30S ribosomal protein S7 [Clostridiaceae bacterium]|nr:30S ribosomal protein S7 [Clostridiaceae bacterium]
MPRKGHVPKREVLPDPVYHDVRVSKLVNNVMLDGKKGLAQRIVYGAFDQVAEKSGQEAIEVFNKALENVMPMLEVKARRVGGSNYQVPIEVRPERRQTLALRWIVNAARARSERTMKDRLAAELLDAFNQQGAAFRRKEEMHRMAEANRAFAHYRW